jgi:hypothetical protein
MVLRLFILAVVFLLACTEVERDNPYDEKGINYGGEGGGDSKVKGTCVVRRWGSSDLSFCVKDISEKECESYMWDYDSFFGEPCPPESFDFDPKNDVCVVQIYQSIANPSLLTYCFMNVSREECEKLNDPYYDNDRDGIEIESTFRYCPPGSYWFDEDDYSRWWGNDYN